MFLPFMWPDPYSTQLNYFLNQKLTKTLSDFILIHGTQSPQLQLALRCQSQTNRPKQGICRGVVFLTLWMIVWNTSGIGVDDYYFKMTQWLQGEFIVDLFMNYWFLTLVKLSAAWMVSNFSGMTSDSTS